MLSGNSDRAALDGKVIKFVPSELVASLTTATNEALERMELAKRHLDLANQYHAFLKDVNEFTQRGWPMHTLDRLDKAKAILTGAKSDAAPWFSLIGHIRDAARTAAKETLDEYPKLLKQAAIEANLPLDSTSRDPKYTFHERFLKLEIDRKLRRARLSTEQGCLQELPADIQAVVEAVSQHHAKLFDRSVDLQKFLGDLFIACSETAKADTRNVGDSLPIRKVAKRWQGRDKARTLDVFVLNLSAVAKDHDPEVDGQRLMLENTKNIKEGFVLHPYGSRGYVGFVRFMRSTP